LCLDPERFQFLRFFGEALQLEAAPNWDAARVVNQVTVGITVEIY
jgi:hypothetical protein